MKSALPKVLHPVAGLPMVHHVLGVARVLRYHAGFFDQRAEVWSHSGQLLASSQQMVYFNY